MGKNNLNTRGPAKMISYHGRIIPFTELLKDKNINPIHMEAIKGRIKRGWSANKAFDTPIKKGNYAKKMLLFDHYLK